MTTPVREGETIEGSRTMRNRPYPVLKCSSNWCIMLSVLDTEAQPRTQITLHTTVELRN